MLITSTLGGPSIAQSSRHRIGVCWNGECRNLFQVLFHNEMIFVNFPYQPDEPGLIARVELPPGNSHTFSLTDTADATTQKVKYSHPIDGNAHFSQTGKVRTTVYNQASRLDTSVGHFFSVIFSGVTLFRKCRSSAPSAQFNFDTTDPVDPLYCAGYWLQMSSANEISEIGNPVYWEANGHTIQALAIAPPTGSPFEGWILGISARRGPDALAVEPGKFGLRFVGGLAENLANASKAPSFLVMQYPADTDISALRLVDYARSVDEP